MFKNISLVTEKQVLVVPDNFGRIVKNKKVLKDLLSMLSDSESVESRVRNRNIEEITTNNIEKILINYQDRPYF